jgi:rubrerythrin
MEDKEGKVISCEVCGVIVKATSVEGDVFQCPVCNKVQNVSECVL